MHNAYRFHKHRVYCFNKNVDSLKDFTKGILYFFVNFFFCKNNIIIIITTKQKKALKHINIKRQERSVIKKYADLLKLLRTHNINKEMPHCGRLFLSLHITHLRIFYTILGFNLFFFKFLSLVRDDTKLYQKVILLFSV